MVNNIATVNAGAVGRFQEFGVETGQTQLDEMIASANSGIDPVTGQAKASYRTVDEILKEQPAKYDADNNIIIQSPLTRQRNKSGWKKSFGWGYSFYATRTYRSIFVGFASSRRIRQ